MSEQITISVPADARERDLRRVEQQAEVARRNAAINREYPTLRDEHGRRKALRLLAQKHNCSVSTVKHVLYRD